MRFREVFAGAEVADCGPHPPKLIAALSASRTMPLPPAHGTGANDQRDRSGAGGRPFAPAGQRDPIPSGTSRQSIAGKRPLSPLVGERVRQASTPRHPRSRRLAKPSNAVVIPALSRDPFQTARTANPLPERMRIKVAAWVPAQGRDDAVWMPAPFSSKGYEGSAQLPKKPPAQKNLSPPFPPLP